MKHKNDMLPSVSIVIPAFNSSKYIGQTLERLKVLDYPQDKIELVVVDDASTDNTGEIAKKFGCKVIRRDKKGGCASAKNTGIAHAKNEIIAFIDADVIVTKEWLRMLVAPFKDPRVGGVGGRIKNVFRKNNLLEKFIEHDNYYRTRRKEARSAPGSNSAYRREVFQVVGFMDPYLGEDPDFSYRVVAHGYKIIFKNEAVVYHPFPNAIIPYLKKQIYYAWQRMLIFLLRPQCRSLIIEDKQAPKDLVLATLVLALSIFITTLTPLFSFFGFASMLLFGLFIVFNLPFLYYIYHREPKLTLFAFFIGILRSFAYIIGMTQGILSFLKLKIIGSKA
jgi:cellulose synthase/poly-beta-1,6-N-acetylglucosamine synthase-like glycosyltransferase